MEKEYQPNFSFTMPKNRKIDSFIRMAEQYGMIYKIYHDKYTGEEKVGMWEKVDISST